MDTAILLFILYGVPLGIAAALYLGYQLVLVGVNIWNTPRHVYETMKLVQQLCIAANEGNLDAQEQLGPNGPLHLFVHIGLMFDEKKGYYGTYSPNYPALHHHL